MKGRHLALMLCCFGLGSLFLVNCGSSNSPTSSATPTPTTSSTSGHQLYAFVLESSNGGSTTTMFKISGPYNNTGSSAFSFSLPSLSAGSTYVIGGLFDTAMSFSIPSGAQVITPASGDYGQYYPSGCIGSGSASPAQYTSSAGGLNLTMDTGNGACAAGSSAQNIQYSPQTGTSVVLSGNISESGL